MAENTNKRKYPRIPVTLEMRCGERIKAITMVSKNVSQGGIYVESSHIFPLQADLRLHCKLPYAYGEFNIRGTVVRHEQDPDTGMVSGMAIEFADLTDSQKKMITDYIQNTLETHKTSN